MWNELLEALKTIGGWITLQKSGRGAQREQFIVALVQVHQAANKTRAHFASEAAFGPEGNLNIRGLNVRSPQWEGNREREAVSEAWLRAGEALARCDGSEQIRAITRWLYERCLSKAGFWANPQGWEESGVDIALGKLV